MRMVPVASSDLAAVGYEHGTLYVEFHSGGTYRYTGVPECVHRELMAAPSHGRSFHRVIRNSFPYQKVG